MGKQYGTGSPCRLLLGPDVGSRDVRAHPVAAAFGPQVLQPLEHLDGFVFLAGNIEGQDQLARLS